MPSATVGQTCPQYGQQQLVLYVFGNANKMGPWHDEINLTKLDNGFET
jgi:hypothetical protein